MDRRDRRSTSRRTVLQLAGSGGALALAGCIGDTGNDATTATRQSSTPTASPSPEPPDRITITDSYGREVTVPYPVETMAVINPATYWAVRLLGVQDRVVGVNKGDLLEAYPKILEDNPGVGWYRDPNVEKIAELNPDVLVTHYHGPNSKTELDGLQDDLASFDTKVVGVDVTGMNLEETGILAEMVGKEDAIEPFFEWRRGKLQRVEDRADDIPAEERVSVYYEAETKPWQAKHEPPVEKAGGYNVMNDIAPEAMEAAREPEVDPESVMEADPDYVLLEDVPDPGRVTGYQAADTGPADEMLTQFLERPGVDTLSAAENDRVHVLDYKMTSGEKSWLGVLYLAKLFYPDRFDDLDPTAVHEEFYREWQDNEFQGTYLYPALP